MKSSGSSHERHSLAFAGRAAHARRVRLFSDGTRNRHCPGTRASALGDDGCGVRAQSGELVLAVKLGTPLKTLADVIHPFPAFNRVLGKSLSELAAKVAAKGERHQ